MEELLKFVTEGGFAIAIAIYLLVRMEQKLESLRDSIIDLANTIKQIN